MRLTSRSARRLRRSSIRSRSKPSSARPRSILSARKWSKWSRTAFSTKRAASRLVRRSLVWLWKCGSRMKTESISSTPLITSSAVMSLAFLWPTSSPNARMPLVSAARRPCFVGAAVGGRDGVAVIAFAAVAIERPGDRPFDAALARSGKSCLPTKGWLVTVGRSPICSARWSARPPGNWKTACSGTSSVVERRVAAPADLDAGEEIGLGARELVEPRRLELRVGAEDLRVGREGDGGAAPVGGGADVLERRGGDALARSVWR